jgi:hypothetical protein
MIVLIMQSVSPTWNARERRAMAAVGEASAGETIVGTGYPRERAIATTTTPTMIR